MQTFNLVTTSSLELGFNFLPGNGSLVLSALHTRTSSPLRKSVKRQVGLGGMKESGDEEVSI